MTYSNDSPICALAPATIDYGFPVAAMSYRLFLALVFPDAVKERLSALQVPHWGVRWVKPFQREVIMLGQI